jgi:choline/glycine/proline betaine transport protein
MESVEPAFQDVIPEMERQGLSARMERSEDQDRVWLTIQHGGSA